jgi:hypothetical protein
VTKNKGSFDKLLYTAQILIENSLSDKVILNAVKDFGYSSEKLLEGKVILEEARSLFHSQLKARGEQFRATDESVKAWNIARKAYVRTVEVARIAFDQNTRAEKSLVLSGSRKRNFPAWLMDAETFYGNLLADDEFLSAMLSFGWTAEKLRGEYELVRKAATANTAQKDTMGYSRRATETRDECFDRLSRWVSVYRKIVRIAFAETPQTLEKFGIVV